jgi:3-oxoacyl-[acyl-carrier-protein] synthase II
MSRSDRRTVLTGVGLITPLGHDPGIFWEALRAGRSGVGPVRSFDASALPTRFGAEVRDFDARNYLEKKDRKRLNVMVPTIRFAVAAAQLALNDARVDKEVLDPTRFGVVFGAGTIPSDQVDVGPAARASVLTDGRTVDLRRWGSEGIPTIPPMWMLNYVPNMLASHVSILHNAQGHNNTITQTDLGGLLALGEACRTVTRGRADLVLTGGADAKINPITLVRQCLFSQLSRRNDEPERASRPFDRGRDGLVLGEGAGVLVVEELGHARRRGAAVLAEVVGFGAGFDRDRSGLGLARTLRTALERADVTPEEVDHVNAQGYSTPAGDGWEARGLRLAFGGRTPPVFAAKSFFGNLGPGGGVVELAASLLALRHGLLPGTLNYDEPDPECSVPVAATARPVRQPYFLKVGCTERGQCAAVVCRRWG